MSRFTAVIHYRVRLRNEVHVDENSQPMIGQRWRVRSYVRTYVTKVPPSSSLSSSSCVCSLAKSRVTHVYAYICKRFGQSLTRRRDVVGCVGDLR